MDLSSPFSRVTAVALAALAASVTPHADAQSKGFGSGAVDAQTTTREDVSEVEDLADEAEHLPFDDDSDSDSDSDGIRAAQKRELELSLEEMRSGYDYGLNLSLGPTKPWQTYTFEAQGFLSSDLAIGVYAGFFRTVDSGIIDEEAYDLTLSARGAGTSLRWFMTRLQRLSFELDLGYNSWEARVTPHGTDQADIGAEDLLSASFRGHGPALGLSCALSWILDNGLFIEWVPFGARFSKVLAHDFTRDSTLGRRALLRTIERPAIYGLTNLRLGWYF